MITKGQAAEVVRLFHAEKWKIGTIAAQLGIHHGTVRRTLSREGVAAPSRVHKPSIVLPYVPLIVETLATYPRLPASRLYVMAKERGFAGSPDHFRRAVALHRPRPAAEAYLRLRTLPGEQAQVDCAHFGKRQVGNAERPLMAFVMVLSFSRMVFLHFYLDARMSSFLDGHVSAFGFFGGVSRVLFYDFVARHKIVVLCPVRFCGRDGAKRFRTRGALLPGAHNGQRLASQASSDSSFRQTAFRGSATEAVAGGSHASSAASFARMLISGYRLVVSRLTCPSQPRITLTSTPDSSRCTAVVWRNT